MRSARTPHSSPSTGFIFLFIQQTTIPSKWLNYSSCQTPAIKPSFQVMDNRFLNLKFRKHASNLTIQDGKLGDGRFVQIENGFGDRQTILPGIGQTLEEYSFEIPSDYKTIISIPVFFPIRNVFVMIPTLGIDLGSSQLIDSQQLFVSRPHL